MNCTEARASIAAYVDDELGTLECSRLDAHVRRCGACQRERSQQVFTSRELRRELTRFRAPARLHRRVRGATHRGAEPAPAWWRRLVAAPLAPVAGFAFAALVSGNAYFLAALPSGEERLADNVLDSHLRAVMSGRAIDVVSSDQHTVKPWYSGKLDFSPPVSDFAAEGFPLVGGRIDYVERRAVAALVYQRRKHVVDLFIWPAAGSRESAPENLARRGYNVVHWTQQGMTYWLASDLEASELARLEALLVTAPPSM